MRRRTGLYVYEFLHHGVGLLLFRRTRGTLRAAALGAGGSSRTAQVCVHTTCCCDVCGGGGQLLFRHSFASLRGGLPRPEALDGRRAATRHGVSQRSGSGVDRSVRSRIHTSADGIVYRIMSAAVGGGCVGERNGGDDIREGFLRTCAPSDRRAADGVCVSHIFEHLAFRSCHGAARGGALGEETASTLGDNCGGGGSNFLFHTAQRDFHTFHGGEV